MNTPLPDRETLSLPHGPTPVEWRRSRRARRVTLRIDAAAGAVVVTLPPGAGRTKGMALLAAHSRWVADRLEALAPRVTFAAGAEIPLLGVPHVVRHRADRRGVVTCTGTEITVAGDAEFLPRRLGDWLREEARREITPIALRYAAMVQRRVKRIAIKDQRSRWASCAPDGTLAFSWRLILSPPHVLDYVVAHEVAHLVEMNHSARFWAVVTRLTPHAEASKTWLGANGARLLRYG